MRPAVGRALLAALLVGACDPGEVPAPDRTTACEILDGRDVAAALEGPVGPPAASAEAATDSLAGRSGCAWSRSDGTRAVLVELVRTGDMSSSVRRTGFSAAARFHAVESEHPEPGAAEAVGDEAVYVEEAATLHVLVGRSYVTFEVAATPPSAIRPAAVALATRAVPRLRRSEGAD